jgi:hypothetical protein
MQAAAIDSRIEQERVAGHLRRAETLARASDQSGLDRLQALVRQLLLEELGRYRAAGRFPQNPGLAETTPIFVDTAGTRCAVAHLMETGGEAALVERIARERNRARIAELADEPRLLAWLAAAGLTVAEAAAIQPSYCTTKATCVCDGGFTYIQYPVPAQGVLEAVVTQGRDARVEATYGDTGGVKVRDQILLATSSPGTPAPGTRVLAPVGTGPKPSPRDVGGESTYAFVALAGDGTYTCAGGNGSPPALTKRQFADAVTSADCANTLASYSPQWKQKVGCDGPGADSASGCGVAGGAGLGGGSAGPTSLGILLALVAVLVGRRR